VTIGAADTVAAALTWISMYMLANGLAMIGLALRLRTLKNSIHELAESKPLAQAAVNPSWSEVLHAKKVGLGLFVIVFLRP
jgi:CO dehydrogenase/acetyl-CoA synthase gamma subunit (corrinoid Fe-S protein)